MLFLLTVRVRFRRIKKKSIKRILALDRKQLDCVNGSLSAKLESRNISYNEIEVKFRVQSRSFEDSICWRTTSSKSHKLLLFPLLGSSEFCAVADWNNWTSLSLLFLCADYNCIQLGSREFITSFISLSNQTPPTKPTCGSAWIGIVKS